MKEPLVSVTVCMYNSSKTVLETLESIKSQTYKNIELIISDDDSKDASVQICEKWVEENKSRFVRTQIITHSPNTGTSANLNRAISEARGACIKVIAADDKLLPNCILDFVDFIHDYPEANIVFSRVVGFGNMEAAAKWPWSNVKRYFDAFNTKQLRIILSTRNFLPAPSVFFKKSVWDDVGGFDESIPLLEDWPFWVKTLKKGYKFNFLDKETVGYRFCETSISQKENKPSTAFSRSNSLAVSYADNSLSSINVLFWYLYQTKRIASHFNNSNMLFLLNFANPSYYEYNKVIAKFKALILYSE